MQSHDSERQEQGEHEVDDNQHHKEESLDLDGGEPAPRKIHADTAPSDGNDGETGGPSVQRKAAASSRGRSLGTFLLTHYTFALESDPIHAGSPKVSAPGLPKDKKYKKSFLGSPYGIKMQGTGLADDGHYIRYQGNGTYGYGVGGAAGTPVAWKTVAVDPHVIKMGSHLDIKAYQNKGTFTAKDTGGAIKGKHIDVFAGAIPIKQAYALGTKHSEVFLDNGSGGGGGGPATEHHESGQQHTTKHPTKKPHTTHHRGYRDAPSLAEARAGTAFIRRGMEGPSVKFVQRHVHSDPDGMFGPNTHAAVKKFQRAHHLEVDGIVGPHTMAALDRHGAPVVGGGENGGPTHKGGGPTHGGGGSHPAGGEAQIREQVLDKAKNHLGARYSWAAEGPSMFDCSGFAWYVLHTDMHLTSAGRTTAAGLSHAPYTTPTGSPEKGDLVFYASGGISHVTIATGNGSETIGASGGGSHTHGQDPNAKVKFTSWTRDRRSKSFGSIQRLINHKLGT